MKVIHAGEIKANFDVSRSVARAKEFVLQKMLSGTRLDAQAAHYVENSTLCIVPESALQSKKNSDLPKQLYLPEVKGCHNLNSAWAKISPLTEGHSFEATCVHEFAHLQNRAAIGQDLTEVALDLGYYQKASIFALIRDRYGNFKNRQSNSQSTNVLSFLAQQSNDIQELTAQLAVLKAMEEGRARFGELLYHRERGFGDLAYQLETAANWHVLLHRSLHMPYSPYELGLQFHTQLEKQKGTQEALRLTWMNPPGNLNELLSVAAYLLRVEKQP